MSTGPVAPSTGTTSSKQFDEIATDDTLAGSLTFTGVVSQTSASPSGSMSLAARSRSVTCSPGASCASSSSATGAWFGSTSICTVPMPQMPLPSYGGFCFDGSSQLRYVNDTGPEKPSAGVNVMCVVPFTSAVPSDGSGAVAI